MQLIRVEWSRYVLEKNYSKIRVANIVMVYCVSFIVVELKVSTDVKAVSE